MIFIIRKWVILLIYLKGRSLSQINHRRIQIW